MVATGDPVRLSVCHCRACQRRSGSAFAAQVRFIVSKLAVRGETAGWVRRGDIGNFVSYRFCPSCGATVSFSMQDEPGTIAVPLGLFDDPSAFGEPEYSTYEARRLSWVEIIGADIDHYD